MSLENHYDLFSVTDQTEPTVSDSFATAAIIGSNATFDFASQPSFYDYTEACKALKAQQVSHLASVLNVGFQAYFYDSDNRLCELIIDSLTEYKAKGKVLLPETKRMRFDTKPKIEEVAFDRIVAFRDVQGRYLTFSTNPFKPLTLFSEAHSSEYLASQSKNIKDWCAAATAFSNTYDNTNNPVSISELAANLHDKTFHDTDSSYRRLAFGTWNKPFIADRVASTFHFNVFNLENAETTSFSANYIEPLLTKLSKALNENNISSLSDPLLIAFYYLQGFLVHLNIGTLEWTIQRAHSPKIMHTSREQLLDYDSLLTVYTAYTQGIDTIKLNKLNNERPDSMRFKYLVQTELKPFYIPVGSLFMPNETIKKTAKIKHHTLTVTEDDGRYVTMIAEAEAATNTQTIKIPRKLVTEVASPNFTRSPYYTPIPFGIPCDTPCDLKQLQINKDTFVSQLSDVEVKQIAAFTTFLSSDKIVFVQTYRKVKNALENDDLAALTSIVNEHLNDVRYFSSGGRLNLNRECKDGTLIISGSFPSRQITLDASEFISILREMHTAIHTLKREDLTLIELIWLYSFKQINLIYNGTPTHFIVEKNGIQKSVHSTKVDICALEKVI